MMNKTNNYSIGLLMSILFREYSIYFKDWREHGLVTPVKDQQDCGACWAFAAIGTIEGAWAKSTGNLVSFSEEELIQCSSKYGL